MRSFKDREGVTIAVAKERDRPSACAGAEVIDLIQLPSGSRPRPFAELEIDEVPRSRSLSCDRYDDCLSFAAHAKWRGFSCRTCPRFRLGAEGRPEDAEAPLAERGGAIIRLP